MSSYLGTVLVTTPLVGTPLLSAILYFSGESQLDNEKWANPMAEFESFENLCEDGYNWSEENQSCEEISFLGPVEIIFKRTLFINIYKITVERKIWTIFSRELDDFSKKRR